MAYNGASSRYAGNAISTAKYTWYNFLYKSFAGQFVRLGNQYFLLQTFVMCIGEYSSLYASPLESWSMVRATRYARARAHAHTEMCIYLCSSQSGGFLA